MISIRLSTAVRHRTRWDRLSAAMFTCGQVSSYEAILIHTNNSGLVLFNSFWCIFLKKIPKMEIRRNQNPNPEILSLYAYDAICDSIPYNSTA